MVQEETREVASGCRARTINPNTMGEPGLAKHYHSGSRQ
jgi:hypothetical protein